MDALARVKRIRELPSGGAELPELPHVKWGTPLSECAGLVIGTLEGLDVESQREFQIQQWLLAVLKRGEPSEEDREWLKSPQHQDAARKMHARRSPEERSAAGRKAARARWDRLNAEPVAGSPG